MRTVNLETRNRALQCKTCEAWFGSRPARKQHEKDSHFLPATFNAIEEPFVQGCTGKTAYGNKKSALSAILTIIKKGRKGEEYPNRAYLCPNCKKWHLTSKPERKSA